MKLNVIDLFAGCGGLAEGFLKTKGYQTLAAIDWELLPVKTLRNRLFRNYGYSLKDARKRVLHFDIQKVKELLNGYDDPRYGKSTGLKRVVGAKEVDVVVGGPPCQAYSFAGRVQDKNGMRDDYRNYLFESYVKVVKNFKPKYFVFENVQGILSAKPGGDLITNRIRSAFSDAGYLIPEDLKETALFDLSYFGVPQKRKRVFIFGVKKGLGKSCVDSFYNKLRSYEQETPTTSMKAFADLSEFFPSSESSTKRVSHEGEQDVDKSHVPRFHNKRDIDIFKILAEDIKSKEYKYASSSALIELYKEKVEKKSKTKFQKYNVIREDRPSNTIPAHLHKDGLRHIHPDPKQARSITVREAARLQSFDDDFEFLGPLGSQFKMVGNAVPPKFATLIAESILAVEKKKLA